MSMFKRTRISHAALAVLGGGLVLVAAPVAAQVTPPATGQTLERVEITGSAIRRIDAETAVPVTVISVDELKRQGVTTVEQALQNISSAQTQVSGSRSVGSNFGGAVFADLRGVGSNKTLVLLNGRRVANNAVFDSQVDINLIPFDAIERIEVLRDGASALYGTDAIGGVINFITKRDFRGGTVTVGVDVPSKTGGSSYNFDLGGGIGDLSTDRFNIFGSFGYQRQKSISGLDRPFQTRLPAGLSPTTFPGNYFQGGATGNPANTQPGGCGATPGLIPGAPNADGTVTGCQQATSAFVDHVPETEKYALFLKGQLRVADNVTAGLEYFGAHSQSETRIAPVPYGALRQNRTRPDGSLNPFYPGNPGSSVPNPNIPLDPAFAPTASQAAAGTLPGFVNVRFRDFQTGPRTGFVANNQHRVLAGVEGTAMGWDFNGALSYNQNRVRDFIRGYSNGNIITPGVLNGIINPFGPQDAAGAALISSAGVGGLLVESRGTVYGGDFRVGRELGDWLRAGRPAAVAVGIEGRREDFLSAANTPFASQVVASTGIDPNTRAEGSRNVYAAYAELNVPIFSQLEVTAALRFDNYSDFGSTTNPKVSFRYEPTRSLVFRGSASTGFRAPSLYELNAAQTYTNTPQFSDPQLCPVNPVTGLPTAVPGAPPSQVCNVQFQELQGGNKNLQPEESKQFSLGLVFQPVRDLSVGVDYFWIKVDGSIGAVPSSTIIADQNTFASYYFRNPQGFLSTDGSSCPDPTTCGYLDARNQNLGNVKTSGLDFTAAYRLQSAAGNFLLGSNVTYLIDYEYQDFATGPYNKNLNRYVGVGPIFRWQGNASIGWDRGPWGAGIVGRYKSGYADYDTSSNPRVSSYTIFDAYGAWSPVPNFRLTLGVRNLFDRDPPFSNQQETFQGNYDPRFTDPVGRTFYARGTLKF